LNLPKRRKVALTFAATPLYIERLRQEGGKNIEQKKLPLEQCLVPFSATTPLDKITTFDVERYKKERASHPMRRRRKLALGERPSLIKPATINRELAALSHLLNKAAEYRWIDRPLAKIRKLKEGSGRIVYLSPEQCDALLDAAKADQNRQI